MDDYTIPLLYLLSVQFLMITLMMMIKKFSTKLSLFLSLPLSTSLTQFIYLIRTVEWLTTSLKPTNSYSELEENNRNPPAKQRDSFHGDALPELALTDDVRPQKDLKVAVEVVQRFRLPCT